MADTKISALTALLGADVADGDLFAVVDVSAGVTKKITRNETRAALLTAEAIAAALVASDLVAGKSIFSGGNNFDYSAILDDALGASNVVLLSGDSSSGNTVDPYFIAWNAVGDRTANGGSNFIGIMTGGTRASPLATPAAGSDNGPNLIEVTGYGYDGERFYYSFSMNAFPAEDWTPSATGTDVTFNASALGEYGLANDYFLQFRAASGTILGRADMVTELLGSAIKVNGSTGLASFSGAVTNITVVNGIVTAAS